MFSTLEFILNGFTNETGETPIANQRFYPPDRIVRQPHRRRLHSKGRASHRLVPIEERNNLQDLHIDAIVY
jgi:hypothetical protein